VQKSSLTPLEEKIDEQKESVQIRRDEPSTRVEKVKLLLVKTFGVFGCLKNFTTESLILLRLNASGRPNTCKSNGSGCSNTSRRVAHG
jgi:hypothetical protein